MKRISWRAFAYWVAWFFGIVLALIVAGAVIGAIVFPIGGLVFKPERSPLDLGIYGARFLSFIFMIWAPAVALVICVMKAWKRHAAREVKQEAAVDPDAVNVSKH